MAKKKDKIKTKDLADKSMAELKQLLKKAQEKWVELRMDLKIGKLKDVHVAKKKRKEIARIKTLIREKELKELVK